jgi:hypothetical protein
MNARGDVTGKLRVVLGLGHVSSLCPMHASGKVLLLPPVWSSASYPLTSFPEADMSMGQQENTTTLLLLQQPLLACTVVLLGAK